MAMVVLEVSQIWMRKWAVAENQAVPCDIYLTVTVQRKKRKCRCCRRGQRQHSRDSVLFQGHTDGVRENGEMLWRSYNEDNFLVALFTLEGSSWRGMRPGDVLNVFVDVYRLPRGSTLKPNEESNLVQVMQGELCLGVWGVLTLRPPNVDRNVDEEETDTPYVSLELRPRSMRPFMLEFAKPETGTGDQSTDMFGRRNRMSQISQAPVHEDEEESLLSGLSGNSSGSQTCSRKLGSLRNSLNGSKKGTVSPKSSTDRGSILPGGARHGLEWLTETNTDLRRPVKRTSSTSWSQSERASINSQRHWVSESGQQRRFSSGEGGSDVNVIASVHSDDTPEKAYPPMTPHSQEATRALDRMNKKRSSRSKHLQLATRLRLLVRQHLKTLNDRKQSEAPKVYTRWTPGNWEDFWKSCWPGEEDLLGEGYDVVPLMEAEFRKDCIIFFNTIFPRAHNVMFEVLRNLAFEPGDPKGGFKLLSDGKQHIHPFINRMSSTDLGSFLDDDASRLEELGLGKRLTVQAGLSAYKFISRSKSSLVSDGSDRAKGVFSNIFFRSNSSSKAANWRRSCSSLSDLCGKASPTASHSPSVTEIGQDLMDNGSVSSDPLDDEGAFTSRSGETRATFETVPSSSPLDYPRLLPFQELNKQPCVCTVTTPKGVFVDEYSPRIMLLKRMLICFAVCGVYYTEVSNCSQLAELWPYPLASVLGHGSRVLIRLEDVEASEFINFLMFGDPLCVDWKESGLPYPLVRRLAATHSVQLDADTGNLMERKLQVMSASDTYQNISDGIRKKHLGVNLPIGGVGNPSPMGPGHFIDFTGRVVQRNLFSRRTASFHRLWSGIDDGSPRDSSSKSGGRGFLLRAASGASLGSVIVAGSLNANAVLASMDEGGEDLTATHHRSEEEPPGSISPSQEDTQSHRPRRGSVTSTGSVDNDNSSCLQGSQAGKTTPLRRQLRWMSNIQGGHLYIRIDDFGTQVSRAGTTEGSSFGSKRSETRRWLLKRPRNYNLIYEQAKLRRRLGSSNLECGDIFFTHHVPEINQRRSGLPRVAVNGMPLVRMSSEPSLAGVEASATFEDVRWAKEAIVTTSHWPLRAPPSPLALRLVLDHFDPLNSQLYGTGSFRSIEDLWRELRAQRSFLMKRGQGLQRYVEPVVLQLRWKGYILMNTHEVYEDGQDETSRNGRRNNFMCVSMRPDEQWREVLERILQAEFSICSSRLFDYLKQDPNNEDNHHTILEETVDSPSYPGMYSFYRCHMVHWDIKDEAADFFNSMGLPFDTARRQKEDEQEPLLGDFSSLGNVSDFSTYAGTCSGGRRRRRFWRWVPEQVAREFQRFLNMEERTADDRWAKYAYESEGVVQFPTTMEALAILFQRCGIDVSKYDGKGKRKTLKDLWLELLNQESYLMMNSGLPHRIVESLFVKVRWRYRSKSSKLKDGTSSGSQDIWYVLAKRTKMHLCESMITTEELDEENSSTTYTLLNTRKYREENWEDCMERCVTKELRLSKRELKIIYDKQADEDSRYAFHDLVRQSTSFPGILTLYRTHLVTITFKEDYANTPGLFERDDSNGWTELPFPPVRESLATDSKKELRRLASGLSASGGEPERHKSGSSHLSSHLAKASRSGSKEAARQMRRMGSSLMTSTVSYMDGVRSTALDKDEEPRVSFLWIAEQGSAQPSIQEVHGTELWVEARKREERHKVSSVLIGLEGTAPQRKSPFGVEHDASGQSAKVSAFGGRKWRAYRKNNALQIPSDEGGMHLRITRRMFKEFMDTCDMLSLVDPSMDLMPKEERFFSRGELERRHLEKELFKQVMSGNGRQAKQVVEATKDYCSTLRTPARAYKAVSSGKLGSTSMVQGPPAMVHERVTVNPVTGDIVQV